MVKFLKVINMVSAKKVIVSSWSFQAAWSLGIEFISQTFLLKGWLWNMGSIITVFNLWDVLKIKNKEIVINFFMLDMIGHLWIFYSFSP